MPPTHHAHPRAPPSTLWATAMGEGHDTHLPGPHTKPLSAAALTPAAGPTQGEAGRGESERSPGWGGPCVEDGSEQSPEGGAGPGWAQGAPRRPEAGIWTPVLEGSGVSSPRATCPSPSAQTGERGGPELGTHGAGIGWGRSQAGPRRLQTRIPARQGLPTRPPGAT